MQHTILIGDVMDKLRELPDQSVQCVVTSPPYFGLRNYGVDGQIGLESTIEEYLAKIVSVFREVRRVLRDDGTLWLNLGDSYVSTAQGTRNAPMPKGSKANADQWANMRPVIPNLKPKDLIGIPWRIAFALQEVQPGWYLRSDIIWSKPNPMPESVRDRPTKAHEYIFLLSKQPRYFFDAEAVKEAAECDRMRGPALHPDLVSTNGNGGLSRRPVELSRNIRSVWTIATAPFAEAHFATFPPELAERCIKAGTSEKGCCAACGAPFVRITEHKKGGDGSKYGARAVAATGGAIGGGTARSGLANNEGSRITVGWKPSCTCNADTVPCVVLDPFAGSGTVGMVCEWLGRNSILIDLNPEYEPMMRGRIATPRKIKKERK